MAAKSKVQKHEVFGELTEVAEELWEAPLLIGLLGKSFDVRMNVSICEEDGITQSQLDAFSSFQKNWETVSSEIETKLLEHYQSVCEQYRNQLDITDPASQIAPLISSTDELKHLVTPEAVCFPDIYDLPTYGILLKCTWDVEHGLGILIEGNKVTRVGNQTIVL